jgi:5-methylcytosine-specific restriction protein A
LFSTFEKPIDILLFFRSGIFERKMKTYLFLWNPKKWNWDTLEQDIDSVNMTGTYSGRWSCGNNKSIESGDRVFLMKVGTDPKGIIGSGYAKSTPFKDNHWDGSKKDTLYIEIEFELLLNPSIDPILTLDVLMSGNLQKQNWIPMSSGVSIKPEVVDELENTWFGLITKTNNRNNPFKESPIRDFSFVEGKRTIVSSVKFERNPHARKKCLEHFGFNCVVCDFNFEETYGVVGREFIEVHHLNPISDMGGEYSFNPIESLRPVCSNCHSIIHRQKQPLSIQEVKNLMKKVQP